LTVILRTLAKRPAIHNLYPGISVYNESRLNSGGKGNDRPN